MKKRHLALAAAFMLLVLCLTGQSSVQAQDKVYHQESVDSDITILPNSDVRIVEARKFVFTSGSFHYAYIYVTRNKFDDIDQVEVWEGDRRYTPGQERDYTFTAEWDDDAFRITWYYPYTSDASRTFRIAYTVKGALRYYDGGDQLWWKAVDKDRTFPILSSQVTVHLPASFSPTELKTAAYGVTADTEILDGSTVRFTSGQLAPGQELEVRVQFPHGVVPGSPAAWQVKEDRLQTYNENYRDLVNLALLVLGLLLLIGGSVGVYLFWHSRGRDVPVGLVAEYLTEPPGGMPPAVAGTLVDEKADMKDIVATIVDLARRGFITIRETEQKTFLGLGRSTDFVFELSAPSEHQDSTAGLLPYEKYLLQRLFGRSSRRELSDLRNKFYTAIPKIQERLYKEVVKRDFFKGSPQKTRSKYIVLGVVGLILSAVGLVAGSVALSTYTSLAFCPFSSLAVLSVVFTIVASVMPRKTAKGAEQAAKIKAFKRYFPMPLPWA